MKDNHKYLKRFLAFALSVAMVITYMPVNLIAYAENEAPVQPVAEEVVDDAANTEAPAPQDEVTTEEPAPVQEEVAEPAPAPVDEEPAVTEEQAPAEEEQQVEEPAEETPVEETAEPEKEESFPAQTFNADKGGVKVLVKAPEGALPEGTDMVVTPANTKAVEQAVKDAVDGEVTGFKAVDITFVNDGEDVEPKVPVQVYMNASGLDAAADKAVVHIADNGVAEVVDDATVNNAGIAKVVTDQFSIYAIVETGEDARLKVVFKNGSAEIASMYVKKGDSVNDIVYDPGAGTLAGDEIFKGWTTVQNYSATTEAININGVRSAVSNKLESGVTDGEELVFYALILKKYVVDFVDDRDVTINTYSYLAKEGDEVSHTINEAFTPASNKQNFEGWKVESGADNIVGTVKDDYQNDETVKVTGSVTFKADAPFGEWLVFDENGKGGTYNAPQFVKSGEVTKKPVADSEMTRKGYTFAGWYTDAAGTTEFTFGQPLTEGTTIYAKWTPNATANYTVIIWKQNVDGKNYDFAESVSLRGSVGSAQTGVTDSGSGNNAYATVGGTAKRYTGFHLKEYDEDAVVNAEGNTIVNVYYDRNTVTLTFYTYSNRRWNQYDQFTGLYGSKLADNGYTWPTDYDWYSEYDNWGDTGGTRTTFMDAFIPTGGGDSMNFYGSDPSGTATITFLKQDPDDSSKYTVTNTVKAARNSSFYISDKYNGYEAYQYSTDGTTWRSAGTKQASTGYYNNGQAVSYNSNLYIRFNCKKYNILYDDGVYVDGNGNPVSGYEAGEPFKEVKDIVYDSDLSSYNKGGAKYYEPKAQQAGFVFAGWYSDDACTHEFTFEKMPEGITVYAKWVRVEYRVFLYPNVPRSDTSLTWGSDNQATNFRVGYGKKISCPDGHRDEYDFVGWYKDSACTQAYNANTVLNDSTVKTDYNKSSDLTDPSDKYGNDKATSNNDTDRSWITKKFEIWAKWRATIDGAKGINVAYDANGGSNAPEDNSMYLDSANAVTGAASTAPEGKQFDHWVLQTWNGSAFEDTDTNLNPGDLFQVLKANAKRENAEDWTEEEPRYIYTVQLKAVYKDAQDPVETTITYDPNGGTGSAITENLAVNEEKTAKAANTFSRTNYVFDSWNTEPDGSGLKVEAGEKISADLRDLVKNTKKNTLYAQWVAEVEVEVTGSTKTLPFNGSEQKNTEYTVKYKVGGVETTTLPQGITVSTTAVQDGETQTEIAAKGTNAGTYTATVTATLSGSAAGYTIKTASDADDIVLIITKNAAKITVTPDNASRQYDGTPLTQPKATVTGVPEGFTYEVTTKGSVTDVGTADNEVASFKILKDGKDVTTQFSDITEGTGSLEVTKRPVTLTSGDATKPYDGTAITNADVKDKNANGLTVETGWVDGEGATYAFSGSQTEVGSSANAFTYTLNNGTKADNYTITKTEGTLTVTELTDKVTVTITENSGSEKYDGTEKTVTGYTVDIDNELYTEDDFTFSGNDTVKGTDAGSYPMELKPEDFTNTNTNFSNVEFVIVDGTLEISKRAVTLTSADDEKVYDGKALTNDTVTVGGDGFATGEGATYDVTGTQTEVGSSANAFTYTLNNGTKADNYTITKTEGTLEVTPVTDKVTVTITENSGTGKYDGTEKTVTGYTVSIDNELYTENDFTFSGDATIKGTDAGSYPMELKPEDFTNTSKNFTNVEFKIVDGTLEISKRTVTMTSATDSKTYDGKALTNDKVTETGDGFVEGEGATYDVTGTQTDAGSSKNTFTYTLKSGTKADNYEITQVEGTLTVTADDTEVVVVITENSGTAKYDGTEKTATGYEVTSISSNLYKESDFTFSGDATVKGTDAGSYDMELKPADFTNNNKNFTKVTFQIVDGTLEISKRTVTLTSATAEKVYDGKALTNDEVTVGGDGFADGEGATYDVTGTQTDVGESPNSFSYTLNEGTKAANYDITTEVGTLKVTPVTDKVTVTITGHTDDPDYNGNEQKVEGYDVSIDNDLYTEDDFTFSGDATAKGTDVKKDGDKVDSYPMGLKTSDFENISKNFTNVEFVVNDGSLKIKPIDVTIESASAKKVYDGTPLTKHDEMTIDGFVDGEGLASIDVTGSQTYVGTSDNTFTYKLFTPTRKLFAKLTGVDADDETTYKATKATNADNYNITVKYGTLEVTDEDVPVDKVATKKHEDKEYKLGETVVFTIEVTNIYAEKKTITVEEQEGVTITSESEFKDVEPGAKVTVTAEYVVTEADILAGEFNNKATVKFSGVDKPYEPEDKVDVEDPKSHLTIDKKTTSEPANGKTYALGETITYEVKATNDGNMTLKNIEVTDELTGDVWTVEELAPGESKTFTAEYTVTEKDIIAGSVKNEATATAEPKDPEAPKPEIVPGTTEDPTDESNPHLTVVKETTSTPANGKSYEVGETVTYEITVTNDGNLTVKDIEVKDDLTGDAWNIESLAPDKSQTFNCEYTVTEEDAKNGSVTNIATATGTTDDPNHPYPTVVPGEKTVPVAEPEAEPTTGVKTGDDTNIPGMVGGFFASVAALFGALFIRRRRSDEE